MMSASSQSSYRDVGKASRLTSSIANIPLYLFSGSEGKAGRLTYQRRNPNRMEIIVRPPDLRITSDRAVDGSS